MEAPRNVTTHGRETESSRRRGSARSQTSLEHTESGAEGALTPEMCRNSEVLSDLYKRHYSNAYHRAITIVRNPEAAEDIAHDAFLKAIAASRKGHRIRNLAAWLNQVIYHSCLDHVRGEHMITSTPLNEGILDESDRAQAVDMPDLRDRCRAIGEAVDQLPAKQRSALLLVATRGLAYKEAAEAMEISVNSIRALLARARSSVRQAVGGLDAPLANPALFLKLTMEESRLTWAERARAHISTKLGDLQAWVGSLVERTAAVIPQSAAALVAIPLISVSLIATIDGASTPATAGPAGTDVPSLLTESHVTPDSLLRRVAAERPSSPRSTHNSLDGDGVADGRRHATDPGGSRGGDRSTSTRRGSQSNGGGQPSRHQVDAASRSRTQIKTPPSPSNPPEVSIPPEQKPPGFDESSEKNFDEGGEKRAGGDISLPVSDDIIAPEQPADHGTDRAPADPQEKNEASDSKAGSLPPPPSGPALGTQIRVQP